MAGRHPRRVLAALVAVLAAVVAAACSGGSASKGLAGNGGDGQGATLTVGLESEPPGLDPAGNFLSLTAFSLGNALFDRLMVGGFGDAPRPSLAESLTEAPDRLSWVLQLRPNITFTDGTPLDGEAVKFNLDRQRASQLNAATVAPITGVEVTGATSVRINLAEPWVALPSVLAGIQGIMVSPTAAKAGDNFARKPVGTGPYILQEWVADDHLTVVRNPDYWGEAKPKLERIVFRFIPDEAARLSALKAGDVGAITALLPETARSAEEAGYNVVRPPQVGQTAIYLNNTKPPFNDARVRRAALLAIDLDAFSQVFGGEGYDGYAFGAFPTDSTWYAKPTEPPRFDVAEARRLVAAYEAETGKRVAFTYRAAASSQSLADAGKALVKFWQDAGMDATLTLDPDTNSLILAMLFRQYDAAGLVAGYYFDPDSTVYDLYKTGKTFNLSGYSSAEMDALLDTGRHTADRAVRADIYAKVQQLARRDVPMIPLSFGTIFVIGNKSVTGLEPSGFFPAKTVGLAG